MEPIKGERFMVELMKAIVDLEKRIQKLEKLVIKEDQEINDTDISRIRLLVKNNKNGITKAKIKNRIQSFNEQKIDSILEYLICCEFIVKKEVYSNNKNKRQ
jgi:CRISPR/Cas system-associated endoribonuclease Cas2